MKKKIQFSKLLIIFETIMVARLSEAGIELAKLAILNQMEVTLPWIVTMVTAAWGAYGFSVKYYYAKAMAENTKDGIVYDAAFLNILKEGRRDD